MTTYKIKIRSNSKIQTLFFLLFCLIIFINPFPLGSNRVWAWSFEALFATSLIALMIIFSIFSKTSISWHRLAYMKFELSLIVFWLVVNVLYLIPVPLSILTLISPTVAQAYTEINQSSGYLSLDVYATFETLMLSLYYFTIFILGVTLVNTRKRIKYVLAVFLILGVFESIYSMYLVSIGQTGTLIQVTTVSVFNASGTFINKNHLVAFLSLCFILGLTLRMILTKDDNDESYLGLKVRMIRYVSRPLRLLDFSLFLILAGIWNTHSRAGLLSFILSILFLLLLVGLIKKIKMINYKTIISAILLSILLVIVVADDIGYILETLGVKSDDSMRYILNSAQGRLLAFEQVVENFSQYWFTGVGPGAYPVFFVNHRSIEQTAFFDHAHNDYIEFIIEYGVFSFIILLLMILFLYRIMKYAIKMNKLFYQFLAVGVVSSMIYMLLHGNMDFNARIPANIVTIIVAISVIYGKIVMSDVNIIKK